MRRLLWILIFSSSAHASFYGQHADGWHWYEDLRREEKLDFKPQIPAKEIVPNAVRQLQAFKKKVEEFKAVAVMNPTTQTVRAYMEIQKELLDRSSLFAQRWLEALYLQPELDYTRTHPVSQVGRQVYIQESRKELESRIHGLSKTHGLFFFFSSGCAYCKAFAPIVRGFSQKYGWKVLAVSMDGTRLPEFPDAQNDNGAASRLGVQALPALLAVCPNTGSVIPLSYGLSAHDQIEDRIRVLLLRRMP